MFRYFIRWVGTFATDFFEPQIFQSGRVGLAPQFLLISMIGINTRTKKAEQNQPGLYEH
jgi:hypothetical protein